MGSPVGLAMGPEPQAEQLWKLGLAEARKPEALDRLPLLPPVDHLTPSRQRRGQGHTANQ